MFKHQKAVKAANRKRSELGEFMFEQYCDALFVRLVQNRHEDSERTPWIHFVSFEDMERIERDDMTVIDAVDMAIDTYYSTSKGFYKLYDSINGNYFSERLFSYSEAVAYLISNKGVGAIKYGDHYMIGQNDGDIIELKDVK